jgi:hypothetical protein
MYFLISSQTEIQTTINKKIKAKRDYQSSPTEGKRKKTCPNRVYQFINICPMGMYSIVSHKVIKNGKVPKTCYGQKRCTSN